MAPITGDAVSVRFPLQWSQVFPMLKRTQFKPCCKNKKHDLFLCNITTFLRQHAPGWTSIEFSPDGHFNSYEEDKPAWLTFDNDEELVLWMMKYL